MVVVATEYARTGLTYETKLTDADLAQQRTITVISIMLIKNAGINDAVQLETTAMNSHVQVNKCKCVNVNVT